MHNSYRKVILVNSQPSFTSQDQKTLEAASAGDSRISSCSLQSLQAPTFSLIEVTQELTDGRDRLLQRIPFEISIF